VFGVEGDLQYTGLSGSRSGGALVPPGIFDSFTQFGWTAGGGVEWKFAPRWSVKAEYLYVDLGSTTYTSLNSNVGFSASIIHNHHLTENIARIGLNYSFWSTAN
jgi:outer membrane immunogenic protein